MIFCVFFFFVAYGICQPIFCGRMVDDDDDSKNDDDDNACYSAVLVFLRVGR